MSREKTYQSVILKKQPYGEGDEIVTLYTNEAGKLRALAKAVKFPKSKLAGGLQVLFLAKLVLSSGRLPKIIGVEVLRSFARLRENLAAVKLAFFSIELTMKFTPDEQKNPALFNLLLWFLEFLNSMGLQKQVLEIGLLKFKLEFSKAMGLGISFPQSIPSDVLNLGFSPSRGKFFNEDAADYKEMDRQAYDLLKELSALDFNDLPNFAEKKYDKKRVKDLQEILSQFLRYHLDRDIKSERFLEV
jgi:DNA repair protein RecO (recombination protein O)